MEGTKTVKIFAIPMISYLEGLHATYSAHASGRAIELRSMLRFFLPFAATLYFAAAAARSKTAMLIPFSKTKRIPEGRNLLGAPFHYSNEHWVACSAPWAADLICQTGRSEL